MKFIPCEKCAAKNGVPAGFLKLEKGVQECSCHIAWRKREKLLMSLRAGSFDTSIIDYDIKNYIGEKSKHNVDRIEKFLSIMPPVDDWGVAAPPKVVMYLYGPNGTQKTTISNYIGRELIKKGYISKFILMNDLSKLLQKASSFGDVGEAAQAEIEKLEECDALFIDESFDREKMTIYKSSYQVPFLDSFLRTRLSNGVYTCFISNVSPEDIDLSNSLNDLINRNLKINDSALLMEDSYKESFARKDWEKVKLF